MDDSTEMIRASVDKKIDRFVEGDLAHATKTLSALWEVANGEGEVKAPSGTVSIVSSSGFPLLLRYSSIFCITRPPIPRAQRVGPPWR